MRSELYAVGGLQIPVRAGQESCTKTVAHRTGVDGEKQCLNSHCCREVACQIQIIQRCMLRKTDTSTIHHDVQAVKFRRFSSSFCARLARSAATDPVILILDTRYFSNRESTCMHDRLKHCSHPATSNACDTDFMGVVWCFRLPSLTHVKHSEATV